MQCQGIINNHKRIIKSMKNKNKAKPNDSDDDYSEASQELDTDNTPKNIPVAKLGEKPRTKKIVINISDTQYTIIEEIAEELGWVIQKDEGLGDWDVWWTDREIEPHTLFRMNLHQKINHFPGIYILARKNLFGLGLMAMKQHHPQEYNFFPETWAIPLQFSQFRHYFQSGEKGKTRTYIVKPEALSQGRGIFLTRNIEDIINGNKYVVQRYIKNPLLIDKLKFDLRIYVLLAGTDPLRLYIYHQGLTRFATEPYQQPTPQNINRSYIHLTNYSLNKNNPNYIFNTSQKDMDKGHKRSLSSTYQKLAKNGVDVENLKASIEDAIVKSVISGLPNIRHQYQYCQPEQYEGGMCFHILGFDVMLTDDFKPIVIEVNHTPSFETGTPLDYLIKKNLIKDTLKLMRITQKNKRKNFERAKNIAKVRLQTGRRQILKGKQRQQAIKKARQNRDQLQKDIMGGYKRIFPPYDPELQAKYNKFYETALKISRQDNDVRKKLLNDEKPKEQKKPKKKAVKRQQREEIKQDKKREQRCEDKPLQMAASNKQEFYHKKQIQKDKLLHQIQLRTLNNLNNSHKCIQQSNIRTSQKQIEQQIIDTSTSKQDFIKNSFRTKVSKKKPGSNQQLIKYTESIKKFNELMVKFVVGKDLPVQSSDSSNHADSQAFNRLKQKISFNRDGKSTSQQASSQINNREINNREIKPVVFTPIKTILPNGIQSIKLQVRNGSFVKPKNYIIADAKDPFGKNFKRNSSDLEQQREGAKNEGLLGGLIVENHSIKAYSKLLKPQLTRGIGLNFNLHR